MGRHQDDLGEAIQKPSSGAGPGRMGSPRKRLRLALPNSLGSSYGVSL